MSPAVITDWTRRVAPAPLDTTSYVIVGREWPGLCVWSWFCRDFSVNLERTESVSLIGSALCWVYFILFLFLFFIFLYRTTKDNFFFFLNHSYFWPLRSSLHYRKGSVSFAAQFKPKLWSDFFNMLYQSRYHTAEVAQAHHVLGYRRPQKDQGRNTSDAARLGFRCTQQPADGWNPQLYQAAPVQRWLIAACPLRTWAYH